MKLRRDSVFHDPAIFDSGPCKVLAQDTSDQKLAKLQRVVSKPQISCVIQLNYLSYPGVQTWVHPTFSQPYQSCGHVALWKQASCLRTSSALHFYTLSLPLPQRTDHPLGSLAFLTPVVLVKRPLCRIG